MHRCCCRYYDLRAWERKKAKEDYIAKKKEARKKAKKAKNLKEEAKEWARAAEEGHTFLEDDEELRRCEPVSPHLSGCITTTAASVPPPPPRIITHRNNITHASGRAGLHDIPPAFKYPTPNCPTLAYQNTFPHCLGANKVYNLLFKA